MLDNLSVILDQHKIECFCKSLCYLVNIIINCDLKVARNIVFLKTTKLLYQFFFRLFLLNKLLILASFFF